MLPKEQFDEIKKMSDDDLIMQSYSQTREKTMELSRRLKDSVELLNLNVISLNSNISDLNETTTRYSKILIRLTIGIGILTALSVILTALCAYLAYKTIPM